MVGWRTEERGEQVKENEKDGKEASELLEVVELQEPEKVVLHCARTKETTGKWIFSSGDQSEVKLNDKIKAPPGMEALF